MKKYGYIISALGICHSEFAYTLKRYKDRFRRVIESDQDYASKLRIEIQEALNDPEWSWKEAAREASFCYYDGNESEESHLNDIKNLMWDILFPTDA